MSHPLLITIALIILLLLSAFFSSSETSYTSFSIVRMKNLAKTKKAAKTALKLRESYDKFISTILIGNNLVNIAGTTLVTSVFIFHGWPTGICTLIVTIVILIFGEIMPKSFSKIIPEKIAIAFAYPLLVLYYIFYPISFLFDWINSIFKKIFKIKEDVTMTEEEFELLVEEIHEDGILNGIEQKLILNTIEYGDLLVEDIMTKGRDIVFVKDGDSLEKIQEVFEKYNYSRLPIAKSGKYSTIYGLIYQKEFYEMLLNEELNLHSIIVTPLEVKPNIKISRLLKTFQKEHQHMAIVKNGSKVIGLITMEDIIEELVGEIEDEYDSERDEQAELDDALEELEELKEKNKDIKEKD